MVKVLYISSDSDNSIIEMEIDSNKKKVKLSKLIKQQENITKFYPISYGSNMLKKNDQFIGIRLVGVFSKPGYYTDYNTIASNIIGKQTFGPAVFALTDNGQYINFRKNMLQHVTNIQEEERYLI